MRGSRQQILTASGPSNALLGVVRRDLKYSLLPWDEVWGVAHTFACVGLLYLDLFHTNKLPTMSARKGAGGQVAR